MNLEPRKQTGLFVEGINDGIKRRVCHIPQNKDSKISYGHNSAYVRVYLELNPGQWVPQTVDVLRIQTREIDV